MKKTFYAVCILVLLLLSGTFVYKEYFIPVDANPGADVNVSEYTITVATNAGTVVDYVDYDVISADEYAIETVGFNRQFVQLSIYNTETEEQLQNNSAIEIGDELNIHIAVPEGYKLNAFYVGGYYATNDYVYTVTGDASIYIAIERIQTLMCFQNRTWSIDHELINCDITVLSGGVTVDYNDLNSMPNHALEIYIYYGDIITFNFTFTGSASFSCFERSDSDVSLIDDVIDDVYEFTFLSTTIGDYLTIYYEVS